MSEYDFVGSLKKGKNQFILAKVNRLLEKLQASNTFFFDVSRNVPVREIDTVQDKLIRYLTQKNIPIIFSAVNTFFKKQNLTIQSDLNTLHTSLYNRSDDDEKKLFSTFGKIESFKTWIKDEEFDEEALIADVEIPEQSNLSAAHPNIFSAVDTFFKD